MSLFFCILTANHTAMKKSIRTLLAAMTATALLTGCATQKNSSARQSSSIVAIAALDAGYYVIDIDEVYAPNGQRTDVTSSYFSVEGNQGLLNLSSVLFRNEPFRRLSDLRASYDVQVEANSVTEKGDRIFQLKIANKKNLKAIYEMYITLYAGSDQCAVRMGHARGQNHLCTFRGRLRPA